MEKYEPTGLSGVQAITLHKSPVGGWVHHNNRTLWFLGNAIKYLWRCGLKVEEGMTPRDKEIEDLKKAVYYINRKINNLEKWNTQSKCQRGTQYKLVDTVIV